MSSRVHKTSDMYAATCLPIRKEGAREQERMMRRKRVRNMTRDQLREEAKKMGVKGRGSMTADELRAALTAT